MRPWNIAATLVVAASVRVEPPPGEGVTIAWIGMFGVVLVAVLGTTIPSIIGARRGKETSDAIGHPNGRGNVVEMLTAIIVKLGRIEENQTLLDNRVTKLERRRGKVGKGTAGPAVPRA